MTGRVETEPRAGAGSGPEHESGFPTAGEAEPEGEPGLDGEPGPEPESGREPEYEFGFRTKDAAVQDSEPGLKDEDPFSRQRLLDGWRPELLAAATVVVAGVGALGNEVARILAMSGVGRLILTDPDTIETSNLSRAVLFRAADVGRPKASTAAAALHELAPWTVVEARDRSLAAGVGLAELREATVVAGCLDSRAARLLLAGRCQLAGVAMVDGGTGPWRGQVGSYPPAGRCYGCWLSVGERAVRDDPWSCQDPVRGAPQGASAPVSALVGAWQALTIVRYCLGVPTAGPVVRILPADGRAAADRRLDGIDPTCPLHGAVEPGEIADTGLTHRDPVGALLALLGADDEAYTWLPFPDTASGVPSVRLRDAPAAARLCDLGVAPRELIPIHRGGGPDRTRYLQLRPTRVREENTTP